MGSTGGGENSAPRFVHKPALRQEDDGNRLIFECELAGSPQPAVFWFRGDSQIEEDDRTYVRVQETAERWVNSGYFVYVCMSSAKCL